MDAKIYYFWLVICMHWKLAHSNATSVSGEVLEDVIFFHKTFPGLPSERAIIEYSISYPYFSSTTIWEHLILGIYTTQDHVNIVKNCTYIYYGQMRNQVMHQYVDSRYNDCVSREIRHCTGNITIQDFKPRNFSFSFGYPCDFPFIYSLLAR